MSCGINSYYCTSKHNVPIIRCKEIFNIRAACSTATSTVTVPGMSSSLSVSSIKQPASSLSDSPPGSPVPRKRLKYKNEYKQE